LTAALFQMIPPMIGAFVGAPVLARELETGTYRLTWAQGFGRARWTLALPSIDEFLAAPGKNSC
jgi:hypothetical protein